VVDTKITGLTALDAFATGDLLPMVDDPAGLPVTKKATIDQVANFVISALDADLTSWATVTRASGFDTFVATPSGANLASLLTTALPASKGGTGLTALAANVVTLLGAADYSAMRTQLGLVIGTNVQAWDADLDSWASVTRASGFDTFAATPSSANLKSLVTDETGSGALVFGTSPTISTALTLTGATETTSNPVLNATQTWNAAGVTFAGIKLNITNTASASGSALIDLQVGGSSKFQVRKDGMVSVMGNRIDLSGTADLIGSRTIEAITTSAHINLGSSGVVFHGGSAHIYMAGDLNWQSAWSGSGANVDLTVTRDAANTLAQRNGTNAQTTRFYRTYSSAGANYERLALQSAAGPYFELACESAGTGSANIDLYLSPKGTGIVQSAKSALILNATAIPAGGTAGAGYKFSSTSNFGVFFGSGAPSLAAAKGSLYLRSDGSGTGDRAYINTDGSTTWTALTTAA
jgi:hypothetical protein